MSRVIVLIVLIYFVTLRIYSTFANTARRTTNKKDQFFAASMILLYAMILGFSAFEFYMQSSPNLFRVLFSIVGLLYADFIRRKAISDLGECWSLYALTIPPKIVTVGLYQYLRHPYYVSSLVELFFWAMLGWSLSAFSLIFLVYTPLLLIRVKLEENKLTERFFDYKTYKENTPMLFPKNKILEIIEIFKVARDYGLGRCIEIIKLSQNIQQYVRGYFTTIIISFLIKLKIDDDLKNGIADLVQYCKKKEYDFAYLQTMIDYLWILGIVDKKKNAQYRLSPRGEELFGVSRGIFSLVYAYSPIFNELEELVTKRKVYGQHIFRKGEFVGRGSAELATLMPFPHTYKIIQKYNYKSILDVGCGSGDFLLHAAEKNQQLLCYGFDLSKEAIDYAEKKRDKKGLDEKRLKFEVCDAFKLKESTFLNERIDLITVMFVLHEFIQGGDTRKVKKIITEIAENFPKGHILICELCKKPFSRLNGKPSSVLEHHLFHALSKQEIISHHEWLDLFEEINMELIDIYTFGLAEQAYYLIKRRG